MFRPVNVNIKQEYLPSVMKGRRLVSSLCAVLCNRSVKRRFPSQTICLHSTPPYTNSTRLFGALGNVTQLDRHWRLCHESRGLRNVGVPLLILVSFEAVIRVVTQRLSLGEKRCVTTPITAAKETTSEVEKAEGFSGHSKIY